VSERIFVNQSTFESYYQTSSVFFETQCSIAIKKCRLVFLILRSGFITRSTLPTSLY